MDFSIVTLRHGVRWGWPRWLLPWLDPAAVSPPQLSNADGICLKPSWSPLRGGVWIIVKRPDVAETGAEKTESPGSINPGAGRIDLEMVAQQLMSVALVNIAPGAAVDEHFLFLTLQRERDPALRSTGKMTTGLPWSLTRSGMFRCYTGRLLLA